MIEIGENLKDVFIALIPALFAYLAGKYQGQRQTMLRAANNPGDPRGGLPGKNGN